MLAEYRDLLSVKDLAEICEVSRQTIYKEMKDGKFGTAIQIGRAYKIPKISILKRYFNAS
jgi:excisionase family DNA binding protein